MQGLPISRGQNNGLLNVCLGELLIRDQLPHTTYFFIAFDPCLVIREGFLLLFDLGKGHFRQLGCPVGVVIGAEKAEGHGHASR